MIRIKEKMNNFKKLFSEKIGEIIKDKKKMAIVIGVLLVIIILVVVVIFLFNKDNLIGVINNPDGEKFKNEYEKLNNVESEDGKTYPEVNIPLDNVMKYADVNDIVNVFNNKEDAVIYFGYSKCIYCRSAIQVLCDTAASTEIDKIYYLDVENMDDKYNELLNILDEKFITEENTIYSPLVLFVANGKVVSYNKGTLFSQKDPYNKLDDSQIEGLSEIYRYGINDVLENIKINNGN